jgi:hypothetical protein
VNFDIVRSSVASTGMTEASAIRAKGGVKRRSRRGKQVVLEGKPDEYGLAK